MVLINIRFKLILLALLSVASLLFLALQTPADAQNALANQPDPAKGPYPGIYVFLDSANVDPEQYPIIGGNMTFFWSDIELADEVYDWSDVEKWLNEQSSLGKAANIGFSLYDGRCCGGSRTPPWLVWRNEQTVVRCDEVAWPIPRYWNEEFLTEYNEYIQAFARRYDGDPRIAWIEIGTGIFGEAKPADVDDWPCLLEAGLTSELWVETSKTIMEMFANAFDKTPLLYQFAPVYNPEGESVAQRKWLTDYAASLGMGLKHNGLTPDMNFALVDDPNKSYYKAGHWDPFYTWWRDVPLGWESYATQKCLDPVTGEMSDGITMWCVYAGLAAHADYFVFSADLVKDPGRKPYLDFANRYLGVEIDETDSVWVALREHEPMPGDFFPAKGNFSFWLYQNDAVPGGKSKPEWNVTEAMEGRYTRRTDRLSGNPNLYFDVDDAWLYQNATRSITVEVIYLDRGTDAWSLYYDAVDEPDKLAGVVRKGDSGLWLTQTFELSDAYFGNRLPGGGERPGSDFYLASNDFDDYFHRVRVFKSGVAPTPTPRPIVTATPTPTPPADQPQTEPFYKLLRHGVDGYWGVEDTWIGGKPCSGVDGDVGTTPHGSEPVLSLRASSPDGPPANSDVCNALIRFDLSPLPRGSQIVSAYLVVKGVAASNAARLYFNTYDVLRDWRENEATWYQARNGLSWNIPGGDSTADREALPRDVSILSGPPLIQGWGRAYITELVQRWLDDPSSNRGVMLRPHGNFVQWDLASSENPEVRWRPALVIYYYPPGYETPTPTPTPTPTVTPTPTATATPTPAVGAIAGSVFHDVNGDGVRDENESGISGVMLTLTFSTGAAITETTDAQGYFHFPALAPGVYVISEEIPSGWGPPYPDDKLAILVSANYTHEISFAHQPLPTPTATPTPASRLWLPLLVSTQQ